MQSLSCGRKKKYHSNYPIHSAKRWSYAAVKKLREIVWTFERESDRVPLLGSVAFWWKENSANLMHDRTGMNVLSRENHVHAMTP